MTPFLTLFHQDQPYLGMLKGKLRHQQTSNRCHKLSCAAELLEALSLSNAEVFKFNGDPLRYFEFIRSLDNLIGRSALDNGAKLLKLFSSCEGEPKKIVQCCMIMDPAVGYGKARTLLEERFGCKFKISQAWVRKVTSGPNLRPNDKSGLQRFSDDLKICNHTLEALGMMSEMSNQQYMMKIIERLPYYLKTVA